MAAVNAAREIEKVEATLRKLNAELQLATALVKRHEAKASSATFAGSYTPDELAVYKNNTNIITNHPVAIAREQQLLAALTAAKNAKPTFRIAAVGEEGEDGCFYYDDEDKFLDMMEGEEAEEGDDEEWAKEEEEEMAAFASVTAHLKKMGFDPATFSPETTKSTVAAVAKPAGGALLPHEKTTGSDNGILRFAKLGDVEGFKNEENIEGIDLATFSDNNRRTLLHYAADGGCVELVQYLLDRGLSPSAEDEKGLTPLAIAVILQRRACVDAMTVALRKTLPFVPGALLDPVEQSMAFIPAPPRFIMSKGAPALPPRKAHAFWGTHQATTVGGIGPVDVSAPEFNTQGVLKFLGGLETAVPGSYYSWLSPVHPSLLESLPSNSFAVYTPNCDVVSMASLMVGATLLAGPDRRCVTNAVAMVGNLAIGPSYRKGTDASTILGLTRSTLLSKGAQVAVFTTPAAGPAQVSTPVCRVKWYRRTLNTVHLIDNTTPTIVRELYPDFVKYEATLRIDSHLKSLFRETNQLTLEWVSVKTQEPSVAMAYAAALLKFLDAELPKVSECHLLYDTVETMVDNLLKSNEVYVVGTPEKITDVAIFAARTSREKAADDATAVANAAIHVFSLFTSLKEDARLLEMTKIAGSLVGAEVFYASNTHGLSEDNFRVAMLEEQITYGTNLYVMAENFGSAVPKMDPKKVFLPFALL